MNWVVAPAVGFVVRGLVYFAGFNVFFVGAPPRSGKKAGRRFFRLGVDRHIFAWSIS